MNSLEETRYLMNKYKIKANKNLGQNFLIDDSVIEQIVDSANITNEDLIIEIGPGLGTLTNKLLEKAKKVMCIELDKNMVSILNDRFKLYESFDIIQNDVLKMDLNQIINDVRNEYKNIKVVANLPYYITTQIITKLLEDKLGLESITVMIQKEVADRLIEKPGGKNTGAITYCINYYCDAKKVIEVPNTSFIPSPKVTSEVIKLTLREAPPVEVKSEKELFRLIKFAFMQRRKTLANSLTNAKVFEAKDVANQKLKQVGLAENIRPEQLTLQDFANLANIIYK